MVALDSLLAGLPEPLPLTTDDVMRSLPERPRRLVVIDDHPSGSQSMSGVPVLSAWSPDQIEWAMGTGCPCFYIVVGTRALSVAAAEDRYLDVVSAVLEVAKERGEDVTFVIRSDSTLRGYFPLDTDIVVNAIETSTSVKVDGVVLVPAFPEAGRITVDSTQYVESWPGEFQPVGETRFGKETRFPFSSSELREWVAERSRGRYRAESVKRIPLDVVRDDPNAVAAVLMNARHAEPVVVDAVTEEDLRSVAIGATTAESMGKTFVYRVGPPYVRAAVGQPVAAPLSLDDLAAIRGTRGTPEGGGLVVVGTPVPLTRRQLRVLETRRTIRDVPVSVPALLDSRRASHVEEVVRRAAEGLEGGNVMVRLSEMHVDTEVTGDFAIDPRVGRAVSEICHRIAKMRPLSFVVARGGSVVQAVAHGLGVRRATVAGPLLDGIISLWEPLHGPIEGVPFAVYAGGVGTDESLADIVDKLSGIVPSERLRPATGAAPPAGVRTIAVLGLGSRGMPLARRLGTRYSVTGFDEESLVRAAARSHGIDMAPSGTAAVKDADCTIIAVRGADNLRETLFDADGIATALQKGSVVVVVTAVGSRELREIAAELATRDVHVVDAPMTGGFHNALDGELLTLVGGAPQAVDAVREVLEYVSASIVPAGSQVGDGQAMKAVSQLLAAVNLAGVAEAMTLGIRLGLNPDALQTALSHGSASSFMLRDRGPRMRQAAEGAAPNVENRLGVTANDLAVALEIARESALSTPVAAATEQFFLRAVQQLAEKCDDSEIVRLVSPRPL